MYATWDQHEVEWGQRKGVDPVAVGDTLQLQDFLFCTPQATPSHTRISLQHQASETHASLSISHLVLFNISFNCQLSQISDPVTPETMRVIASRLIARRGLFTSSTRQNNRLIDISKAISKVRTES
jgi:hypothetical protein